MPSSRHSEGFCDRLNAGTQSAGEELYSRYMHQLCRVATGLIGERLKSLYGAEDAAHSAFASFFRGMAEKRYHVDESSRLWCLLVTILRHKIATKGVKAREAPLEVDPVDGDSLHEEAVELADAIEVTLAEFKPRPLEICRLFYQEQLSPPEIAAKVGRSRWAVRRALDRFGRRLANQLGDDSAE